MPFYEYQCAKCGHHLEVMQKISDSPMKKCPECGKSALKRLMSAPVFRLKGSGWYETDFKSDQDNKRNLADKPEAEASKDEKKEDKKEDKKEEKKDDKKEAKADAPKPDAPKPDSSKAGKSPEKPAAIARPGTGRASRTRRASRTTRTPAGKSGSRTRRR